MNPMNPEHLEESIKSVINKGLPEVDFFVSAGGITVSSVRLNTARFVPFDVPGKWFTANAMELRSILLLLHMESPSFVHA
jgi:hypothetical protein